MALLIPEMPVQPPSGALGFICRPFGYLGTTQLKRLPVDSAGSSRGIASVFAGDLMDTMATYRSIVHNDPVNGIAGHDRGTIRQGRTQVGGDSRG